MKLKKILFLFFASISIYKITISNPKYSLTRIISFTAGILSKIPIPKTFRKTFFWILIKKYGMIEQDMLDSLENFKTLQDFFTRKVKKRDITHYTKKNILVPTDSKILSISKIITDEVLLIKGVNYSLCEFYTGKKGCKYNKKDIEKMKKNKKNDFYSIIFYLSPGDYHRYHSPFDFQVKKSIYIPGSLYGVDEITLAYITKVYENNERVILEGESPLGSCKLGIVGALNVGSILLTFDKNLRTNTPGVDFKIKYENYDVFLEAGEEMGMFKLGSTVVMLLEVEKGFEFVVEEGMKVRYGDLLGN